MSPRSDFRNHTTKSLVQLSLRGDHVREHVQITIDNGSSRFITRRLNRQQQFGGGVGGGISHVFVPKKNGRNTKFPAAEFELLL